MVSRQTVVWAPDPFNTDADNPRPWLVIANQDLPYPDEESIAVALTTQGHHVQSIRIPSEAWIRGEPRDQGYVLPWSVATLKDDLHVVGTQGRVTESFAQRVADTTVAYLRPAG